MNVLIFGAKGYLAQRFASVYPDAVLSTADIADSAAVDSELNTHRPDVVINAAGKTGRPNIDWCEDHKEETLRANVTGPLVLLDACRKRNIFLVHLSSGCIYEGDGEGEGFSEEDPPNFFRSFYSRTKAWAEQVLREFPVLILRLRMPFDSIESDRNLICKIRKYSRVLDVQNSITYVPDFLAVARALIERRATGIYNVVNQGTISPYQIMQRYKDVVDPAHAFERLTLDALPQVTKAARSNCILSTAKLAKEGITLRPLEEALEEALIALKGSPVAAHV